MILVLCLNKNASPLAVLFVTVANINHVSREIVGEGAGLDRRIQFVDRAAQRDGAQLLLRTRRLDEIQVAGRGRGH